MVPYHVPATIGGLNLVQNTHQAREEAGKQATNGRTFCTYASQGGQPASQPASQQQERRVSGSCVGFNRTEEEAVELLRCLAVGSTEKEKKKKSCSAVLCVVAP